MDDKSKNKHKESFLLVMVIDKDGSTVYWLCLAY